MSSFKRLVYRTPTDVINEVGLKDAKGRVIEQEIYTVRHHWILLLRNLLFPLGTTLLLGGLSIYLAAGGDFLETNATLPGEAFDIVNWSLVFMLGMIAIVWLLLPFITSNKRNTRQVLIAIAAVLAALLYFRYQGGRVFNLPASFTALRFDELSIVLLVVAVFGILFAIYTVFDWLNDFLILTDQRVIYDDEKLFVRQIQDQITIDDIQNVVARTGEKSLIGYLKYYLKFGTIVIQSASFRQDIVFKAANNPKVMQDKIMGEVKKLQKNRSQEDFKRIVETKILKTSSQVKAAADQKTGSTRTTSFLGTIFTENPEKKADGTIIWHPHWIFAVMALARPVVALVVVLLVLLIGINMGLVPGGWLGASLLISGVVFVVWAAWVFEDYRNDRYILTPTQVIDIEKIPIGPEDRRTAGLGALQNVQLKTTFIGRIIGYGDVEMETAGGKADSKFTFHGVPAPNEVVALINKYRNDFRRGEKERTLQDMISLLEIFYTTQHQEQ